MYAGKTRKTKTRMNEIYEYPDFFARFYDTIYKKVRTTDTDYFHRKIKETSGKILEIGVGTGRFFLDALNNGADIYGIDVSESMTEILKKKLDPSQHFRIKTEDAVYMKPEHKFNLIIAPFRVFSHILDTNEQLKFLNNVYDHLNEDGIFIFDVFVPNPELLYKGITENIDFEGEYEPGKKLKRISTSVPDIVNQLLTITMRFEWDENGTINTKRWDFKMRFYFRYELEHLIKLSNLKLHAFFGDYNEGPLDKNSKEFVLVCRKNKSKIQTNNVINK